MREQTPDVDADQGDQYEVRKRPDHLSDFVEILLQLVAGTRQNRSPHRSANCRGNDEVAEAHVEKSGGDRDDRPDGRDEAAEHDERDPVVIEPVVDALDVLPVHGQQFAVAWAEGPQAVVAESSSGEIPDDI